MGNKQAKPALWGGIECTINRVNNDFLDQLELGGFYEHPEWINAIAALDVKVIRFPVLWEKHQPALDKPIDWKFSERQLDTLNKHGITPIAGLLHHGSGPLFTNLSDANFPRLFSEYASQVANRFPWIKYYTPVNEPLTTARFSGLYGLWYPHKKNDAAFIKMLLNELKATVLAMNKIREVNPQAQLVQTEDLGKTYSTPLLSYQAEFENHRRWLTFDILSGRVNKMHPLWNYFMRLGTDENALQFFIDNPCPPDIIGVNHYLTSERFLDERTERYAQHLVGGNSLHNYADTEAVRVRIAEQHGIKVLLKEIWDRYHIPLAITEVHLHCTREEQLRWLKEVYDTAATLNNEGIHIMAVTSWAMLGSFGWNTLLTCKREDCDYETGAFDISNGFARPTALSGLIKDLVHHRVPATKVLEQTGWWKRSSSFVKGAEEKDQPRNSSTGQPIVILGKTGVLGDACSRICTERNLYHQLLGRQDADICNSEQLEAMVHRYQPWCIINAAGFAKADDAENNPELCYRENYLGPQKLAILSEKHKIKLVNFSTDLVFDGKKKDPYDEDDPPDAVNVFGHSKQLAEIFCKNVNPSSLIIRTSAFFLPWNKYNFVYSMLSKLAAGEKPVVADDINISPTYVPHLVHAMLDLVIDNEQGIWHLTNNTGLSWYQFACRIAERAGFNPGHIKPGYNLKTAAMRPPNSMLTSKKYKLLPDLNKAIEQYLSCSAIPLRANIAAKKTA